MSDEQKIIIDDDVPLPKVFKNKYPFNQLGVGQSFFVPKAAGLANIAWREGKILGKKFTVRTLKEDDVWGQRVWRIQ